MSETATLETPAQAVAEPTPVTAPAAVETVASTPAVQGETVSKAQAMEALFEAQVTGDTKEANRIKGLLEAADKAPVQAEPVQAEPVAVTELEPPVAETEPSVEPEEPANTEQDDAPEKEPNRFRFKDPTDRLIAQTAKTLKISLAEAARRIAGEADKTQPPAPEIPGVEPVSEVPQSNTIAELETSVADLERQIDEIATSDGLYGADAARLTKELSRATADLATARLEAKFAEREAARENVSFEAQRSANEAATVKQYTALSDPNSPLSQLWYELSVAAHSPSHPDHQKALSVDGPAYFAAKAAKILGAAPAAAKPSSPVVPAAPATQPPPATRPAAGTKGSAPPPPAKTSADIAREREAEFEAASTGNFNTSRRPIGGIITR